MHLFNPKEKISKEAIPSISQAWQGLLLLNQNLFMVRASYVQNNGILQYLPYLKVT